MHYETLRDGFQIPKIGLGTWTIGGESSPDYSQDDALVDQLQSIISMGYTHLDTAEMYAANHTEELVGRAIADFDRDELFVTTKVWRTNLAYDNVHRALDASLRRLGTDYVDLYLIHWPEPSIPLSETFRALNEAAADGRVRRVGVSNFDVSLLKQSMELCETPIMTNQVRYNLHHRQPEKNGVLEFCQQNGIVLTAYCPLKDGVLSNKTVVDIARKVDATPGQVAIQWLTRQPGVIMIPKSLNKQHLQENLDALELAFSEEEITQLARS